MFHRPGNVEALIVRIQAGEDGLREQLIADSMPEIRHLVRRVTHSWLADREDEFSIALQAFNQAIDRYRPSSGSPFFSYAYLAMRHRLLDWIRQQHAQPAPLSLSAVENDDDLSLEEQLPDQHSGQAVHDLEIRESLLQLELDLAAFGYTIPKLTAAFPKHQDSQAICIRISRQLSADDTLYCQLLAKKRLPCAELALRSGIPVKTIEKHRGSIIYLSLLLRSDLQVIQSYIRFYEKEASR
jgi:RNA polymerase sigma factor